MARKDNKAFGSGRERKVRKILEEAGWWVSRASGSLGDADLIALANGRVGFHPAMGVRALRDGWVVERAALLIEVKATAAGPFAGFGPASRDELLLAAELSGSAAWLAWWPPRARAPKWFGVDAWPSASQTSPKSTTPLSGHLYETGEIAT